MGDIQGKDGASVVGNVPGTLQFKTLDDDGEPRLVQLEEVVERMRPYLLPDVEAAVDKALAKAAEEDEPEPEPEKPKRARKKKGGKSDEEE